VRARAIAVLMGCVALVLPLTAADAAARGSTGFQLTFKAHGYVFAAGGEGATVIFSVSRHEHSKRRGAETDYVARGTTNGGLHAVFPGVGRISMRFKPTGHWRASAHCASGPPRLERAGVFVGRLHFVGERHYLTVVRRRAGGIEQRSSRACPSTGDLLEGRGLSLGRRVGFRPPTVEPSPAGRSPRTRLFAGFRSGPLARAFDASKEAQGRLLLTATEEDVVDELGTYRIAFALAPRSDLQAGRKLSSANVKGVAPFTGAAALRRAKNGARSWTGDLAASFLGDPGVAMTGPLFKTKLSRGF
jgi:hypothetical protein